MKSFRDNDSIMLGAIAGDLAAWTYEHDREMFFSSLVSDRAVLSSLGTTALETSLWAISHTMRDKLTVGDEGKYHPLRYSSRLIRIATLAWMNHQPREQLTWERGALFSEKDEWYASDIISELIYKLHSGQSKKEVLTRDMGKVFKELKSSWDWKSINQDDGLLLYLMRGWDCFEKAWDFTSAIHNAARWEGVNRHLLCCITGAIAEAMYGCEYRFLKQKYGDNHYSYLKYPEQITGEISKIHSFQFETRFFFPKNSALTNVEKHFWKPYHSKHERKVISFTNRYKIFRAFYTGWDDRYGFYLDDGWVYTYRSGFLIARFHIHQNSEDYVLADFQLGDETVQKSADLAIEEALYSCYYHF